jgi:hypothetical protein
MSDRMNQSDGYDRMNEFANTQQNTASPKSKSPDKSSKEPIGDYIDFEEIK